jgi:hypothetical protein
MLSGRRVIITAFCLTTIVSAFLLSYNVYLIFGAYDIVRLMKASISKIEVTHSGGDTSLTMYFLFNNSSSHAIELVYAAAFVYLNGSALTPSYAPATLIRYSNPIPLQPFSAVEVPIGLQNIPSSKIPNSSKEWFIKLNFIVSKVPLVGVEVYTFYLEKTETG